jgi:hypothetical protein
MVHCTMPQVRPSRWLRAIKATFCSPVADIGSQCLDVRFGSLADIRARIRDVRFTPTSRHAHRWNQCLLSANSGHKAMLLSLPIRMVSSRQNRGVQHERNLGHWSRFHGGLHSPKHCKAGEPKSPSETERPPRCCLSVESEHMVHQARPRQLRPVP